MGSFLELGSVGSLIVIIYGKKIGSLGEQIIENQDHV